MLALKNKQLIIFIILFLYSINVSLERPSLVLYLFFKCFLSVKWNSFQKSYTHKHTQKKNCKVIFPISNKMVHQVFCPIHCKGFLVFFWVPCKKVVIAHPHAKYYATENACIFSFYPNTSQYYVGFHKRKISPLQIFLTILTPLCVLISVIVVSKNEMTGFWSGRLVKEKTW